MTLHSIFIVGFPEETGKDVDALLDFMHVAQLDRVGAFAYSPVKSAAANRLPNFIDDALKQERLAQLLQTQAAISQANWLPQ